MCTKIIAQNNEFHIVKFPCIYKQSYKVDEKHAFYMFTTFEAVID